jgi:putative tricarboxylic transport membrane protein
MKKGNIIVSIVFGLLSLIIIGASLTLEQSSGGVPGPGTWPIAISLLMLIASVSLFISAIKMKKEDDTALGLTGENTTRVYITMGGLVVYLICMYYIGFCVATFFMLFIYISWYSSYKWYYNIITSLVITVIVYTTFKSLLHVPFRFGLLF